MQPPLPRVAARVEPFDASDPKQVAQAEAAASLRDDQLRQVEAAILATPQGRMWVWRLLSADCQVWDKKISMTGEHENGFWEGRREIGLGLMRRLIRAAPENFARMFTENDAG